MKTWLKVVLALGVLSGVLFVGFVGSIAYLVSQHATASFPDAETARKQFEEVRGRFAGQTPLVRIEGSGADRRVRIDRSIPRTSSAPVEALNLITFEPRSSKLVRV